MKFDIIVIGAGMAGASVAHELAAAAKVLLIEQEEQPGFHATGRSAALFTETYGNEVVRGLTRASRAFFLAPPEGFASHPLVTPRGVLHIARQERAEALAPLHAASSAKVPSVTREDAAFALARVPVLRPDYVAGCVYEPDAMDVDVHSLHQGFLKGFRRQGGQIVLAAPVNGITRHQGGWTVTTGQGAFEAGIVVNAAGAWADSVAVTADVKPVGLVPKRRTAVLFSPPAGVRVEEWPMVIDVDETFYIKPDAGNILASPADETPSEPCDAQPEEWDIAVAIDLVEQATTLQPRRISHRWAGLRTFAPDKTPVVGFDPDAENFFWLAGQGGYGIQCAPAVARLAAASILGRDIPRDIAEQGVDSAAVAPGRLARGVRFQVPETSDA